MDAAGNQLPYIDAIVHTLVEKPEDMTLLAAEGELDMQDRNFRRADYTFLKRSEAQGIIASCYGLNRARRCF